jgi:hypothetical protein
MLVIFMRFVYASGSSADARATETKNVKVNARNVFICQSSFHQNKISIKLSSLKGLQMLMLP